MAPVMLPYLHLYRSGGADYAYYRRGRYRVRLRGEVGSPAFLASYQAAHAAYGAPSARAIATLPPGSLGALIAVYRASPEWRGLALATQRDYRKGIGYLETHASAGPVRLMERQHVRAIRDAAAKTSPSLANKTTTMLSILLAYAVELGWRRDNPALRMPKIATGGAGYRAWTEAEVERFRTWAASRPTWRRAFALALYTGQRGQDIVGMTWASYDGTAIELAQRKTGAAVWVPAHRALRAELAADDRGCPWLLHRDGQPWPVNAFQKAAGVAIRDSGLTGVVWHGLRATAATRLAEAGASEREVMAVTGHSTSRMAAHYTRGASRKRLAASAMARLPGTERED